MTSPWGLGENEQSPLEGNFLGGKGRGFQVQPSGCVRWGGSRFVSLSLYLRSRGAQWEPVHELRGTVRSFAQAPISGRFLRGRGRMPPSSSRRPPCLGAGLGSRGDSGRARPWTPLGPRGGLGCG